MAARTSRSSSCVPLFPHCLHWLSCHPGPRYRRQRQGRRLRTFVLPRLVRSCVKSDRKRARVGARRAAARAFARTPRDNEWIRPLRTTLQDIRDPLNPRSLELIAAARRFVASPSTVALRRMPIRSGQPGVRKLEAADLFARECRRKDGAWCFSRRWAARSIFSPERVLSVEGPR